MQLIPHSHNKAEALVRASGAYAEVAAVLGELPMLTWTGKSTQKKNVVAQAMLNAYIRERMKDCGWAIEHTIKKADKNSHVLDFYKEFTHPADGLAHRIGVEVEFGYHSRLDTDIRKFQSAYQRKCLDAGIIVCLVEEVAALTDSAVGSYEGLLAALDDYTEDTITCPILAIGLSGRHTPVIDLSKSKYPDYASLTGANSVEEKIRTVRAIQQGVPVESLAPALTASAPRVRPAAVEQCLLF